MTERPEIESMSFEDSMKELESLVKVLEKGEQDLETSIRTYERAVLLKEHCQCILSESQRKVQQIIEGPNGAQISDFD